MKDQFKVIISNFIQTLANRLLLILILISFTDSIYSQISLNPNKAVTQYSVDSWQKAQGLPQNSIFSIFQNQEGYLWLATYEGLARFDGLTFDFYDAENQSVFQNGGAISLTEGNSNDLYIGTNGSGLIQYKNGVYTQFTTKNGLPDDHITALATDKEGRVWYGTYKGLGYFKDGKFTNIDSKFGLPSRQITTLMIDKSQRVWVGTNLGLGVYYNGKFENYNRKILFISKTITSIIEAQDGKVWIGTGSGLIVWTPETQTFQRFTDESGLTDNNITALHQDGQGAIWIGTQSGGLNRYWKGTFSQLSAQNGLSGNSILSIFQDREGSLWVGLSRGGLNRIRDGKFLNYTTNEGLVDNLVNCIFEDSKGNTWIGTVNGGLSVFNGSSFQSITQEDGLPNNYVRTISEDQAGNIWIGTYGGGLCKYDPVQATFQTFTIDEELPSNVVRAIITAKDGSLWIGTKDGLANLVNGEFEIYNTSNGLANNSILQLYEDLDENIWIGTEGSGVNILQKDGTIKHIQKKDGLANNLVFAIYQGLEGNVWIGTKGGLSRYKDGELKSISARNGLASSTIHSTVEDNLGRMWFSSNDGVFWIQKKELNDFFEGKIDRVNSVLFNENDGMKSSDCAGASEPEVVVDRKGRFWYPTAQGVAIIDPEHIKINKLEPNAIIKKIIADNKEYTAYEDLEFPAGTAKFEFEFAGLSLYSGEKVRYRYRLEGFDNGWVEVKDRRNAYYTNLSPGYYSFEVLVTNNDGVWSKEPAIIKFYIAPYFYQTIWFYILIGILIIAAGFGIYNWRIKSLQQAKDELSRGIQERTAQISVQYREITRQADELAAFDRIVQSINQEVTLDNVLKALIEQGLSLFEIAEKGIFLMANSSHQEFSLKAQFGYEEDFKIPSFSYEKALAYTQKGLKIDEDIYSIHPFENGDCLAANYCPKSSISIIIRKDEKVKGVLLFDNFKLNMKVEDLGAEKLKRFSEHAISAFTKAQILRQIENKNVEVERSFKKMSDSIRYAQRIQKAIFPKPDELIAAFEEAFIFHRPKDIVSGDFYWFAETIPEPHYVLQETAEGLQSVFSGFTDSKKIVAAVDCTGHGVPGALMTIVGNDLLDSIVKEKQIAKPSRILRQLDMGVKTYLKQEDASSQSNDGMDMSILVVNEAEQKIEFAGAKNPVIYFRNGELHQIKGSKFPIGGIQIKKKLFENEEFDYQEGDVFYLFSDGFQDQFGGPGEARKYGLKRFRELLTKIHTLPLKEQEMYLGQELDNWQGTTRQTDDILLIGIKF